MKQVFLMVDGVNVNATHFAAMKKDEAITAMLADGFCVGESDKEKKDWATNAYPLLTKAVKDGEKLAATNDAPVVKNEEGDLTVTTK